MRTNDSHHDAQEQINTLAKGLEISVEARESFIPGVVRSGVVGRARLGRTSQPHQPARAHQRVGRSSARRVLRSPVMQTMTVDSKMTDKRVPVTVLTGFLGSGKTTLLNHVLTAKHGKKLAIIENEFGEVGIDDALIAKNAREQAEEEVILMMNGCICCTVRQDLVLVLKRISERMSSGQLKLDGVVIETTGMADPAPVAQTFFIDDAVQKQFRLDGIVTLIDAKHIEQHLDEEKPEGAENEAVEQVAFADRLLLNKVDLVSEEDLERVEARLRALNAFAPIQRCQQCQVAMGDVLDLQAFDLQKTLEMDDGFLDTDATHEHDATVTSLAIREPGDVDLDAFDAWVGGLLRKNGTDIFRMKGVLAIAGSAQKGVYQGVHMIFNSALGDEWSADELRESKLIFIGKNLDHDELRAGFHACLATPELYAARRAALRFGIGERVECNIGDEWAKGTVVDLLYQNTAEESRASQVSPYQVALDRGGLIFAPLDDDRCIRKARWWPR